MATTLTAGKGNRLSSQEVEDTRSLLAGGLSGLFVPGTNTRGWPKFQSVIDALTQGTVAQPVIMQMGDSVTAYCSTPLITRLTRSFAQVGWGFVQTKITTKTGTVTEVSNDYTYWINGTHTLIASSGSAVWKTLGGQDFIGNKAFVFLANQVGGGSAIVSAIAASGGATLATQTVSTSGAIGPQVITLTWTTAQTFNLKVEASSGPVVVVGVTALNTSLAGFVVAPIGVGGINLVQMNSAPGAIWTAVVGALTPALITYSMREVSNDVQHLSAPKSWVLDPVNGLPPMIAKADAGYAAPWLCVGPTAASIDLGITKDSAPSYLEGQSLKEVASPRGLAFFDSFTALGSWEDIVARNNSGNDGTHIGAVEQQLLAQKFFESANLHTMFGVPLAQDICNQYTYSYRFYMKKDAVTLGQSNNWIGSSGDGADLQIGTYRWLDVVNGSTGKRGLRVSTGAGPDGGAGVIMATGALVSNSNYYTTDGECGLLVNPTTGVVTLYGRVSGALKSLAIGTLA